MGLSVVMPTVGRSSLWAAVASVVDQLEDDDELVVVADTADPSTPGRVLEVVNDFVPAGIVYVEAAAAGSVFGNAQRDAGMAVASGSHLAFLDDDDVYVHGALDVVRWRVSENSGETAHIFRASWGSGHPAAGVTLWTEPAVREQNVATPMVVLPNHRFVHSWMDGNWRGVVSDFAFLEAAIRECGGVCWHAEVIASVRP